MRSASRLAGVGLSNAERETSDVRSEEEDVWVREIGSLSLRIESSWFFCMSRTASRMSCVSLMSTNCAGRELGR